MRKALSLVIAAMTTAASLGLPGTSQASLVIYAQQSGVNGGAITQVSTSANFTNGSFTGTYGDFTLTVLGAASTNGASLSSLLSAAVSLKNNASDFRTINIYASQTDYSLPVGTPLRVESGLSGTVNQGTLTGSGVFQAYLDNGNAQLGTTGFTNGPQNVAFTGSTFDTGSAVGIFNRTSANSLYSITSQVTANVSGGGEGNFSDHVNVSQVVPEPGTVALAPSGIPIGFVAMARRFKRRRLPSQV